MIVAGPGNGFSAFKLQMQGGEVKDEKVWSNTDNSVRFNTPVLKDGLLFGISNGGQVFCINTATSETKWATPLTKPAVEGEGQRAAAWDGVRVPVRFVQLVQQEGERAAARRWRGTRSRATNARAVKVAVAVAAAEDAAGVVAAPAMVRSSTQGRCCWRCRRRRSSWCFSRTTLSTRKLLATKFPSGGTYAYPVPAGNGIYIKDRTP